MSLKEEWQLVSHSKDLKDLTPAEGSVAQAIARRIRPGQDSQAIPIRTLYAESVGVRSKSTIEKALVGLEYLGVIKVSKPARGSRQPSVITWVLACPEGCSLDHANGNTKLKPAAQTRAKLQETENPTRPTPQDTTRPTPQDTLRSKERERRSLVSFIRETLLEQPEITHHQAQLLEATNDQELAGQVRARAEQILIDKEPSDPWSYLAAIAKKNPQKLFPKPPTTQAPPSFDYLPPELRESALAKTTRPDPFAALKVAVND